MKKTRMLVSILLVMVAIFSILGTQVDNANAASFTSDSVANKLPKSGARIFVSNYQTNRETFYWLVYVDDLNSIYIEPFAATNMSAYPSGGTVVPAGSFYSVAGSYAWYTVSNCVSNIFYIAYFVDTTHLSIIRIQASYDALGVMTYSLTTYTNAFTYALNYPIATDLTGQQCAVSSVLSPDGTELDVALIEKFQTTYYVEVLRITTSTMLLGNTLLLSGATSSIGVQIVNDGTGPYIAMFYTSNPVTIYDETATLIYTSTFSIYTNVGSMVTTGKGFAGGFFTTAGAVSFITYDSSSNLFTEYPNVHIRTGTILTDISLSSIGPSGSQTWATYIAAGKMIYTLNYGARTDGSTGFSLTYAHYGYVASAIGYVSSVYSALTPYTNYLSAYVFNSGPADYIYGDNLGFPNQNLVSTATVYQSGTSTSYTVSYSTTTVAKTTTTSMTTVTQTAELTTTPTFSINMVLIIALVLIPSGLLLMFFGLLGFMIGSLLGIGIGVVQHLLPIWVLVVEIVLVVTLIALFRDDLQQRNVE